MVHEYPKYFPEVQSAMILFKQPMDRVYSLSVERPGETGTLAHISMIENLTEIWRVLVIFPLNSVIPNLMNWAQIIQPSLKITMTIFKKHTL